METVQDGQTVTYNGKTNMKYSGSSVWNHRIAPPIATKEGLAVASIARDVVV